ncbi:flagellar basal body P-ring formation chaperone FlgA [Chthonobacter albigriseus]|uniref:flagellar basal body P-ring formation chaperone FlgA n=1 Tax=Chthonobacter albigriseus TaxID=1683161 RepID=UPI0015EE3FC8|nr:flagellar basal body P-ring formation chaperone FlgA [Chthonobacter albigriseus]
MTFRSFLARLLLAAGIAAAIAAGIAIRPAAAAALLRADVVVTGDVVTLGDLFAGAGDLASTPVFRAPDPGVDGALPASAALAAAAKAGLEVSGVEADTVKVVRASVPLDASAFQHVIARAAASRLGINAADVEVAFDGLVETVHASTLAAEPATILAMSMQGSNGRFAARLAVDLGGGATRTLDFGGTATATVEVPVVSRPVARGAVLTSADVGYARVDRKRAANALGDMKAVIGMAASRQLRPGDTLSASDVNAPKVVGRNEYVTIVYERPGLTLTARGRALSDASAGEIVSVLNEQSRRTIQAVAVSAGTVRVEPVTPRFASIAESTP